MLVCTKYRNANSNGYKLALFNVCYDWFKVTRPFIPKEKQINK